jgi:hypothetical protein
MSTQLPIAYPDVDVPHALYLHHLDRMTAEGLHDKSAIAIQFAWRDERISELEQQLAEAQAKLQQQALEYLSLCGQQDEALRQLEEAKKDAERYRWLRARHWSDSPLCVVANPKAAVRLGKECPSGERLDAAIDSAMGAQENQHD